MMSNLDAWFLSDCILALFLCINKTYIVFDKHMGQIGCFSDHFRACIASHF